MNNSKRTAISSAVAVAIATSVASAPASADGSGDYYSEGEYLTGDFHNHTTCSDGSTSVRTLTRKSLSMLDWFIHVGHSGSGARDCRIDDFIGLNRDSEFNRGLWINSLGSELIKGDFTDQGLRNGGRAQRMWRWQSLQEFEMDALITEREAPGNEEKEAFLGLEWVVPGHEHSSNTITTGQYDQFAPNSDAISQFEYCFARNSDDTSMGGGQGWTCELSEEANDKLIKLFEGRPEEGIADYNSTLVNGINTDDRGDHVKSVAAVLWTQENYPDDGLSVQAHVERQGAFIPDDDEGYNVEHMRDAHSMAPDVSFGFESQPGHQGQYNRGSYAASRPTAGLWTYGGTGCYGAAEAAKPGLDFDGQPLDPAIFPSLGISPTMDPAKVTLCRPGVRTMWDALLSEGRRFWFFGSSDWHNRGSFGPLDFETTNDFWPGEYQENYTYIKNRPHRDPAQDIVDGLRSGNSFVVQGQLIDKFEFKACWRRRCATMGETLKVRRGAVVRVRMSLRDPKGENNSPYKFDNPSLLQIHRNVPINEPRLAHVDLIKGQIHGEIEPTDPDYYNPLAPETTVIAHSWDDYYLHPNRRGESRLNYRMRVYEDSYIRARGSNIPAGTPNERDIYGNPLPDNLSDNIPCADADCPPHVDGVLTADVEAWADIWFYANPIFIEVTDDWWYY